MLQSPTKPTQWGEKGNGFYFYSPYFIFAKIYYFGPIFFINIIIKRILVHTNNFQLYYVG